MTQCSSLCWISLTRNAVNSARRSPHPKKNCKRGIVTLAAKACSVRRQQQALALFRSEPIANRKHQSLGALTPSNPGSQICTEQTAIGSLIRQPANCGQTQVNSR